MSKTLLVIEAEEPGTVILSGSDMFPPVDWTPVKDDQGQILYYEHPWPYVWGFNPGGWQKFNPKLSYEHRSEMAFLHGQPLRQIMLEVYQYIPPPGRPQKLGKIHRYPRRSENQSASSRPTEYFQVRSLHLQGLYPASKIARGFVWRGVAR